MRELIKEELRTHVLLESVILTEDSKYTDLLKRVSNELGLSLKFVFSYGTGIGAFIPIVKTLIEKSNLVVPETSIPLLVVTCFGILLRDSNVPQLIGEIKNRGLYESLKSILTYIIKIKTVFNYVMSKLGNVGVSLIDILSFTTLLIPITNLLNTLLLGGQISPEQIDNLGVGFGLSGIGYTLKTLLDNMVKKLFG